jgi:hypothetical protein
MRAAALIVMILVAPGCGGGGDDEPGDGDAGSTVDGPDGGGGGGGGPDGGGGGGGGDPDASPPFPGCYEGCNSPSDCGIAGQPAYDSDNYSCSDNACVYTGCHEGECGAGTVCRTFDESLALCAVSCSTSADCGIPTPGPYDMDNYSCDGGGCHYTGCHSDAECEQSDPRLGCRSLPGWPHDYCQYTCNTPSDCVISPLEIYDASHYACEDNWCVWLGCDSTAECQEIGADYVCATP